MNNINILLRKILILKQIEESEKNSSLIFKLLLIQKKKKKKTKRLLSDNLIYGVIPETVGLLESLQHCI